LLEVLAEIEATLPKHSPSDIPLDVDPTILAQGI